MTKKQEAEQVKATISEPIGEAKEEKSKANKIYEGFMALLMGFFICLFHTPDHEAFAVIAANDHQETRAIRSKELRQILSYKFFKITGRALPQKWIEGILDHLEAKAFFESPQKRVYVRYAYYEGVIYVDLLNDIWEQVKITKLGWEIIAAKDSPVHFKRMKGMMPLPTPVRGGSLSMLDEFLNADESERIIIKSFLLNALNPRGPFLILVLQGNQGTSKSTLTKLLNYLVDPSVIPLRSLPRSERDLAISGQKCWLLAFDNLSGFPFWLADAFCRVATGGGFSTRALFTDDEEKIFTYVRPLILNGIPDLATRPDIADRSLVVQLNDIPEDKRKTEKDIMKRWDEVRPLILGALYDVVSYALRNEENIETKDLPRMADAARWIMAAEGETTWEKGSFLRLFKINQETQIEVTLEDDPVAPFLLAFMNDRPQWEGTSTVLLDSLGYMETSFRKRGIDWPKGPNALSNRLHRIAPALKKKGITIEWSKSGQRKISIQNINVTPVVNVASSSEGDQSANEINTNDIFDSDDRNNIMDEEYFDPVGFNDPEDWMLEDE